MSKKKLISIIMLFVFSINIFGLKIYASNLNNVFTHDHKITRLEGLIPLLNVVGVDDVSASYTFDKYFCFPFHDFEDQPYSNNEEKYVMAKGYMTFADEYKIIYGTGNKTVDYVSGDYFDYDSPLKIGDAICFAVRCIDKSDKYDRNSALKKAKELGLVLDTDGIDGLLGNDISPEYYNTLVQRMLDTTVKRFFCKEATDDYHLYEAVNEVGNGYIDPNLKYSDVCVGLSEILKEVQ